MRKFVAPNWWIELKNNPKLNQLIVLTPLVLLIVYSALGFRVAQAERDARIATWEACSMNHSTRTLGRRVIIQGNKQCVTEIQTSFDSVKWEHAATLRNRKETWRSTYNANFVRLSLVACKGYRR